MERLLRLEARLALDLCLPWIGVTVKLVALRAALLHRLHPREPRELPALALGGAVIGGGGLILVGGVHGGGLVGGLLAQPVYGVDVGEGVVFVLGPEPPLHI